jgi:hypothetical protein
MGSPHYVTFQPSCWSSGVDGEGRTKWWIGVSFAPTLRRGFGAERRDQTRSVSGVSSATRLTTIREAGTQTGLCGFRFCCRT